ncbi:MAG: glycosyltransferase family 39 protein [Candidatus Staskawiczbacteria bacterium]|nr:glycosyltransferase family 39 protein [Candidatus Staskawiczbacteria bacterium]
MIEWVKKNKFEISVIILILVIAGFFRLYRISEYMNFLGDEGRDALMIQRILVDHDFPLLGPTTSVGNIYLGPLYYYMMTPPMAISWLNPVAGAVMVAIIGILTVGLVYFFARVWFGKLPAILSAFLYAISPVNIINSRSSWNPSPLPFFTLVAILGLYLSRKRQNFRWFILTGISLAFAVQMHYLAFVLLPIFLVLWIYQLTTKPKIKYFWQGTIGAIIAFLFLMLPLVIFDFKYNFLNYRAITTLFTTQGGTVNFNIFNDLLRMVPVYQDLLVTRYVTGINIIAGFTVSILILIPLIVAFKNSIKKLPWSYFVLIVWLFLGFIGLSVYKQDIYDHYLGFLAPVPFLLLGAFVSLFKNKWQIIVFGILIFVLGFLNLLKSPLLLPPNQQLQKTQEIARFIVDQTGGKPLNFALISARNYDSAYKFYLGLYGNKPKVLPDEVTDQLFVVCEEKICDPTTNSKYEISSFGMSKIDWEKDIAGVKVYKLIVNPSGNPSGKWIQ